MRAVRRAPLGALIVVWALLASAGGPATTLALLSGSANSPVHGLAGAVFSPLSIPAPLVSVVNGAPRVEWNPVSISSGAAVSYAVTRSATGGGPSGACPAPTLTFVAGQVRCDDTGAVGGATYSYTVQPYLDRAGTMTWTRPVSAVSNQVSLPRLSFGGVGPAALFSGAAPTVVNYPTGTTPGDLLVLVARNARNKQISPPSGWTTLISQIGANPASAFLVAWRTADAATSTTVAINSANEGAVAWIVRYPRTTGVVGTPVVAHASLVSAQSATAVTSFGASASLTTTQAYASILTIASTITGQIPSLASGSGYVAQTGVSASSATNTFSVSLADQLVVATGSQVASPMWQVPVATNTWDVLTLAFA